MNASNNPKLAAKKAAGINIHLYSDDHPETTVKGTGFKDAATARRTLELVRQKPRNRQVWTINAMFHRAKHHPHQTSAMREAMAIFSNWLEEYKREKKEISRESKKRNGGQSSEKRERSYGIFADDLVATDTKKSRLGSQSPLLSTPSSRSPRSTLESEYKLLFNVTLPKVAKYEKWPIHLNHCLMRVALDAYCQCCWYDKLDRAKGALKSMTAPQIENVIALGRRMAAEGRAYVARLNEESLAYRGKRGPGTRGKERSPAEKRSLKVLAKKQLKQNEHFATDDIATETTLENATSTRVNKISNDHSDGCSQKPEGNANVNESALLQVQRATTGRASCRGCKEKISKGKHRVGAKAWSSGREITVWYHPCCFVGDGRGDGVVRVEKLSRGTTARCQYTGANFARGDLRLAVEAGGSARYYDPRVAVGPLLGPVYAVLPSTVTPAEAESDKEGAPSPATAAASGIVRLRGMDRLDRDDREALITALCEAAP